eukprot:1704-Heterococcus_DN1.PRE.1
MSTGPGVSLTLAAAAARPLQPLRVAVGCGTTVALARNAKPPTTQTTPPLPLPGTAACSTLQPYTLGSGRLPLHSKQCQVSMSVPCLPPMHLM